LVCAPKPKDVLEEILEKGYVTIGYPNFNVDGLIGLDTCHICPLSVKRPVGYFGGILKSIVIAIFGTYKSSYINLIDSSPNTRWEQAYLGTTDLGMFFPSMNVERATSLDVKLSNGVVVNNVGFGFTAPVGSVGYAWHVDPTVHSQCKLCKNLNLKGKIIRAINKRKAVSPGTTQFVLAAFIGCSSDIVNQRIVQKWGAEIKEKTGVDLVYGSNLPSIITPDDVGNEEDLYLNGAATTTKVLVDAYSAEDWLVQMSGNPLRPSESDEVEYPFLTITEPYALLLPTKKKSQKLSTAVSVAVSCLLRAVGYGVNNEADLEAAPKGIKDALYKVHDGIANNQPVCANIVKTVGSIQTLLDELSASTDIPGYVMDTSDMFAMSL